MRFTEAFEAMKNSAKVKLPSWAGYWEWDPEKKTIIMHCRAEESDTGNETMDIRESQRVEYTITNMLSDEWMIANEANCPKLGGRQHMFFGDALRMAKRYGKRIAREGWNGKSQYVEIASAISYMNAAGDMASYYDAGNISGTTGASSPTDITVNFNWSGSEYLTSGGYTTAVAPEPTSGLLILLGMAGLALRRKRA